MAKKRYPLSRLWERRELPSASLIFVSSSSLYPVMQLCRQKAKDGQPIQKLTMDDRESLLEKRGEPVDLFGETPLYLVVECQNIPISDWMSFLQRLFSVPLTVPEIVFFYRAGSYQESQAAEHVAKKLESFEDIAIISGELDREQKEEIAREQASRYGVRLESKALSLLIDRSENLDALVHEIEKLTLVYPNRKVSLTELKQLFFADPQVAAPSLFFALLKKDKHEVLSILSGLQFQRENPSALIALLYQMGKRRLKINSLFARRFFATLFYLDWLAKGMAWPKELEYDDFKQAFMRLAS